MRKRKTIALLLAASMVFSMNSVAFAAEETAKSADECVEIDTIRDAVSYNDLVGWSEKTDDDEQRDHSGKSTRSWYVYGESFLKENAVKVGNDTLLMDKGLTYTGQKKKAADFHMSVSHNGYIYGIKSIKWDSGEGKDVKVDSKGNVVSQNFTVRSLKGWKYVISVNSVTGECESVNQTEAKKLFKANKDSIMSNLSGKKFQAYIYPLWINGYVNSQSVNKKSLKKVSTFTKIASENLKVSSNSAGYHTDMAYFEENGKGYYASYNPYVNKVIVTLKNGEVKKVQICVLAKENKKSQKTKGSSVGTDQYGNTVYYPTGTKNNSEATTYNYKLVTLKKNKDYSYKNNYVFMDKANFDSERAFNVK
ncbi:MAG: hypothetical protein K6F39_01210 [Lachnospiraceae bacterium]|nr:hypothetical protein [Lachnospiraceae bacterium]